MDFNWLGNLVTYLRNLLDIVIVWMVIHYLLKVFRNNARTMQIMKGIVYLFIAKLTADFLQLRTFNVLLTFLLDWGFLAVIVIFQPEIRALLEKMGKVSVSNSVLSLTTSQKDKLIDEIAGAAFQLASNKTGALITIQRGTSLEDYIKSATPLNSTVSKELLTSIFVTTTPLHDGATIVVGDKIACAGAFYPPTSSDIPNRFGARHRAAVGISEISDSLTIVCSEETGSVTIASNGKLTLYEDEQKLKNYLHDALEVEEQETSSSFWKRREFVSEDKSQQSMSEIVKNTKEGANHESK